MAADQLEALEGERGLATIPNEAFETSTVRGLDADTGVQAKTPAVIPGEHVFGVMGLQEAVAASRAALLVVAWSASRRETARPSNEAELSSMNVAKDPLSHGVLEAVQELGCETSGLVEADAPAWRQTGFSRSTGNPVRFPAWD